MVENSDDSSSEEQYIPIAQRSEWSDISPIQQYEEGQAPICAIKYREEYESIQGYFRAILKKQEVSERAFQLTQEVIRICDGNYTAWFYRRKLIGDLGIPLEDEMTWLQECGLSMEKNYQIWHHRRCIAEMLGENFNTDKEMTFLSKIFDSDRKNYHAWSYRVWLIERFQLWTDELEFVDKLLKIDSGNNSVWSYRFFILNKAPVGLFKQHAPGTEEFVRSEIEPILNQWLPKDYTNESCWVYLRGMLCQTEEEALKSQKSNVKKICITKVDDILLPFLNQAAQMFEVKPKKEGYRFILMCLVDVNTAVGQPEQNELARSLMESLRDEHDKIRMNYWQWKINKLPEQQSITTTVE